MPSSRAAKRKRKTVERIFIAFGSSERVEWQLEALERKEETEFSPVEFFDSQSALFHLRLTPRAALRKTE